jgi:hypothetical protein
MKQDCNLAAVVVGTHIARHWYPVCKGNLMISMNHMILARENQSQLKNKLNKLYTHLARENQREKSKVFPAEGVTMYNQLFDKVKGTSPHGDVNPLKQAHQSTIKGGAY